MTPNETAKVLDVSRTVIRRLIDSGVLPARDMEGREGAALRHVRIPARAVMRYRQVINHAMHTGAERQELAAMLASVKSSVDLGAYINDEPTAQTRAWVDVLIAALPE